MNTAEERAQQEREDRNTWLAFILLTFFLIINWNVPMNEIQYNTHTKKFEPKPETLHGEAKAPKTVFSIR